MSKEGLINQANGVGLSQFISQAKSEFYTAPIKSTGTLLAIVLAIGTIVAAVVAVIAAAFSWLSIVYIGGLVMYNIAQLRRAWAKGYPWSREHAEIGGAIANLLVIAVFCATMGTYCLAAEMGRLEGATYAISIVSDALSEDSSKAEPIVDETSSVEAHGRFVQFALERPRFLTGLAFILFASIGGVVLWVETRRIVTLCISSLAMWDAISNEFKGLQSTNSLAEKYASNPAHGTDSDAEIEPND